MAKVTVDGIEVEVPNGASVLQACEAAGNLNNIDLSRTDHFCQ